MTSRRRWLRTLREIERDLVDSDRGLDSLFRWFARSTGGRDMSWVEKVDRRRFLMFGRRCERTPPERVKDWGAKNWKDP